VAALDGRILACNNEFQTVLGASNDELLQMSLFNLMQNHQDVFRAMGEMLKSTGIQNNFDNGELPQMYWSGKILSQRNQNVSVMG
jgi:PAS domain-containing protein